MATKWLKTLHCKSKALDDVVHHRRSSTKTHPHFLSNSSSCKSSVQNLRDIVEITKQSKSKKLKPRIQTPQSRRPVVINPEPGLEPPDRTRPSSTEPSFFPSLTELPEGHTSRNVVEIIFHTSWGEKDFSGRVEMVFKIHNLTRTIARFEEYREAVKCRSTVGGDGGEEHARSVADGNETMRFYCLGATAPGGTCVGGSDIWAFHGGKGAAAVCTFSGSGVAHESAGGGRGRRAMLVCRVIAGRVRKQLGYESSIDGGNRFDSVSGETGGLLVFDSRALLPCFLIIYKL